MSRRVSVRSAVVLFIVLFVGVSTAGAHQVWSQSQAQYAAARAQGRVQTALYLAHRWGLAPTQLSDLRSRLTALKRERQPAGNPLWNQAAVRFDDRLARAYTRLARAVRRRVASVTGGDRASAFGALHRLNGSLATAAALGLPFRSQSAQARALNLRSGPGHSAAWYEATAASATRLNAMVSAAVRARNADMAAVIAAGGGTVVGVQALGAQDVLSAQSDLSLLGVFDRSSSVYSRRIESDSAALQAATTVQQAALAAITVRSELAAITVAFGRSVPSKVILVSTEQQTVYAYQNGKQVLSTPATTGGPELPTDHGVFHIFEKISPFVFHSPFPVGSPYYYDPTPIQYWMPFDGNEGLHDAWWRNNFGPGSNLQPTDLGNGNVILGTHGCVNLPFDAAQFIWNWAPVGTTVVVV